MKVKLNAGSCWALAACLILAPASWAGVKYKVLHNFGAGADGRQPSGPLLLGPEGSLFGVTSNGGGSACGGAGCGTVFELVPRGIGRWSERVLYGFADTGHGYAFPKGNLVQAASGNLYGWAGSYYCCYTAVLELSPGPGRWGVDWVWTNGSGPGLLLDQAGNLYGFMGYDAGPIAELSPGSDGWTYTDLYNFCPPPGCYDGSEPVAPLSWDVHGNLYGTTLFGGNEPPKCLGSAGCGVAFQMTPNGDGTWTYNVLWRFAATKTDGYYPYAGLTVDASGTAYGATWGGGKYGNGTFFKLTPTKSGLWTETILYQFPSCANGCGPSYTLVPDKAGNLYGSGAGGSTACGYGCGVIFKFSPQKNGTWKYSVVHEFNGTDGAFPYGVVLDDKGNIFGTTNAGGKYNMGVTFEITP